MNGYSEQSRPAMIRSPSRVAWSRSERWRRGYTWCTRPDGTQYRKYLKRVSYDDARKALDKLREEASRGPVASDVSSLASFSPTG